MTFAKMPPTMPQAAAISFRNLSFGYESDLPTVLHGISMDIRPQSITAILGPNGSGKTTLLHLLLGLLPPKAGEILLAGKPHDRYSRRDLSQLVGLVPQDEPILFDLSVLEFVVLGRAPYLSLLDMPKESDRQIALDALESVGLSALWQRPFPSLSGGERQLATIARVLAQTPLILLSDEPTSHLDLGNTRRVLRVLRQLGDKGKTIVFTTHDPNLAAAIADYIVLLKQGQILNAGPTQQVLTTQQLSETYDIHVEVIEWHGRPVVLTQS
jgi:iron complex transport system ATP-binding protein